MKLVHVYVYLLEVTREQRVQEDLLGDTYICCKTLIGMHSPMQLMHPN